MTYLPQTVAFLFLLSVTQAAFARNDKNKGSDRLNEFLTNKILLNEKTTFFCFRFYENSIKQTYKKFRNCSLDNLFFCYDTLIYFLSS